MKLDVMAFDPLACILAAHHHDMKPECAAFIVHGRHLGWIERKDHPLHRVLIDLDEAQPGPVEIDDQRDGNGDQRKDDGRRSIVILPLVR